jgi:hypothetical protein
MEENENVQVEETVNAETVETTQEVVETPAFWAVDYGYENEDALKGDFENLISLKQKAEELAAKEAEFNSKFEILKEAENPFEGAEEAAKIIAFNKKGIPTKLATEIMDVTRESMQADPVNALVLAEAIKNPVKFKEMGRKGIEEAIREKYGIEEGEYTPSSLLKSDAFDAVMLVEKTRNEVSEVQNPFKVAQEAKVNEFKVFEQRQANALKHVNEFAAKVKEVPYEFDGKKVSLQVSKADLDAVFSSSAMNYIGRAFDTSTKEGKKAAEDWVTSQVLSHKFQTGEVGKKILETFGAEVKKEVVREVHNGQPVVPDRSGKKSGNEAPVSRFAKDLERKKQSQQQF